MRGTAAATAASELWSAPCPTCNASDARRLLALDFLEDFPAGMHLVRCRRCGTERIDPHPAPMRMERHYDAAYYADGYLAFASRRRAEWRRQLEMLERFEPVRQRRRAGRAPRCLDLGAGVGLFVAEAAAAGWHVAGVEPSAAARGLAAEQVGVQLDDAWPPPEPRFDLVTVWDVLGHVEDPRALLHEARRRLAPHGGLVVKIPNFRSTWHRTRTWMSRRRRVNLLHAPTVIWRFHRPGIVRLLEACGFVSEWVTTQIEPDLLPLTPRWRWVRRVTTVVDTVLDNRQEMILRARHS